MYNSLCNAYVSYSMPRSKYTGFEIVTMIEVNLVDAGTEIVMVKTYDEYCNLLVEAIQPPFYRVNGLYKADRADRRKRCMGDFYDIKDAVVYLEDLTGNKVNIYSMGVNLS